jgi:hypothetical protein
LNPIPDISLATKSGHFNLLTTSCRQLFLSQGPSDGQLFHNLVREGLPTIRSELAFRFPEDRFSAATDTSTDGATDVVKYVFKVAMRDP